MDAVDQALRAAQQRRIASRPDEALLTRKELALLWDVHEKTLCKWEKQGLLQAIRFGPNGHPRFLMGAVRKVA